MDFSKAGEWRIEESPSNKNIERTVKEIRQRLQKTVDNPGYTIHGSTASELVVTEFLNNRSLSNVEFEKLANKFAEALSNTALKLDPTSEKYDSDFHQVKLDKQDSTKKVHKFGRDTLYLLFGGSEKEISNIIWDVGLTGSPTKLPELTFWSVFESVQYGTVLHDITDLLGINKAFWGVDDTVLSALRMGAVAYPVGLSSKAIDGIEGLYKYVLEQAKGVLDSYTLSGGEGDDTLNGGSNNDFLDEGIYDFFSPELTSNGAIYKLGYLNNDGSRITLILRSHNKSIDLVSKEIVFESNSAVVAKSWNEFDENGKPIGDGDIDVIFPDSAVTGEEIGSFLGSNLANYIADDNVFAQIATESILESTLANIGESLQIYGYEVPLTSPGGQAASLGESLEAAFDDFSDDLTQSFEGSVTGTISSFLTAELIEAIGVDELDAEVLSVVVNTPINSIVSNLADGALSFPEIFDGLDFQTASFSIGNSFASLAGNYLASEVAEFETVEGQIGSQIGSSAGALVLSKTFGSLLGLTGSFIPIVGTFVGAFIGNLIGGLVGDIFGDEKEPKAWTTVSFDPVTQRFTVGPIYEQDGGPVDFVRDIAESSSGTVNSVLEAIDGDILTEIVDSFEIRTDKEDVFLKQGEGASTRYSADCLTQIL